MYSKDRPDLIAQYSGAFNRWGGKQETVGATTKQQATAKERKINKERKEGYIKYSNINIYISAASCLVTDTTTKVLKLGRR